MLLVKGIYSIYKTILCYSTTTISLRPEAFIIIEIITKPHAKKPSKIKLNAMNCRL